MLKDKRAAKKSAWRIPESVLLKTAFAGGCFGVYLGMLLFRHKTRHPKFSLGVPLILLAYCLIGLLLHFM